MRRSSSKALRQLTALDRRAVRDDWATSRLEPRLPFEKAPNGAPRRGDGVPHTRDDSLRRRAARFVAAGGAMSVFYLGLTSLLALVGVAFQVALILSFLANVALHFTLQRLFVWSHHREYALAMHQQLQRYLPLVVVQYVLTVAATATLPHWLGLPVLGVFIGVTASYTVFNFLFFRARIFHVD